MWAKHKNNPGFTIVELLIVIVVIAILAAISIVAYNGIQQRARASAASSALTQSVKKISVWQVDFPNQAPDCDKFKELINATGSSCNGSGVIAGNISYQYTPNATTAGTYCITATNGTTSYTATNNSTPTSGSCSGHGQGGALAFTNLVTNPSFETGSTSWTSYYTPTRTQSNEQARYGTYSQKIVTTTDTQGNGLFTVITRTYTADTTIRASAWVFAPINMPFSFSFRSPTQLGSSGWGNTNYIGTGAWQRVEIAYTIPASPEAWYAPKINTISSFPAVGTVFYVDAVMMTEGDLPTEYKDPSTTPNWAWTGTVHASTSLGP